MAFAPCPKQFGEPPVADSKPVGLPGLPQGKEGKRS
jgi:hypothetical protein